MAGDPDIGLLLSGEKGVEGSLRTGAYVPWLVTTAILDSFSIDDQYFQNYISEFIAYTFFKISSSSITYLAVRMVA